MFCKYKKNFCDSIPAESLSEERGNNQDNHGLNLKRFIFCQVNARQKTTQNKRRHP